MKRLITYSLLCLTILAGKKLAKFVRFSFGPMKFNMKTIAGKQLEHFNLIVFWFPLVVDNFFRAKKATQILFHDKSSAQNISLGVGKWMVGGENKNIALILFNSTFPTWMISPKLFLSGKFYFFNRFRLVFSACPSFNSYCAFIGATIPTLVRAKSATAFFDIRRFSLKRLTANLTIPYHVLLSHKDNRFVKACLALLFLFLFVAPTHATTEALAPLLKVPVISGDNSAIVRNNFDRIEKWGRRLTTLTKGDQGPTGQSGSQGIQGIPGVGTKGDTGEASTVPGPTGEASTVPGPTGEVSSATLTASLAAYVQKAGDTMTGTLTGTAFVGNGTGLTGVGYSTLAGTASNSAYATLSGTSTNSGYAILSGTATTAATASYATLSGSATSAANVTGTVGVTNGGTALTSYATGDVIYASGATTLSKLPIGAAGQGMVSRSGIPSWETAAGSGTVTQVNTGAGLTGGPITTIGTVSIDATVVTTTGAQSLSNKTFTGTTTLAVTNVSTLTATGIINAPYLFAGNSNFKIYRYVHVVTAGEKTAMAYTQTITDILALGYVISLSINVFDSSTGRMTGNVMAATQYLTNFFMDDTTHVYVNFGTAMDTGDQVFIALIVSNN